MDQQHVLLIATGPGSALGHWGPSHLSYEDIEWFRNPGAYVFQPATKEDLLAIMTEIYREPTRWLPAYFRMSMAGQLEGNPKLFATVKQRQQILEMAYTWCAITPRRRARSSR